VTIDRGDYTALSERRAQERQQAQKPVLQWLEQAEVAAEQLTGDPNWDLFLRLMQAALEETERAAESCMARLYDTALSRSGMEQARLLALLCRERANILRAVIEIPADLKRSGEEARGVLARLPELPLSSERPSDRGLNGGGQN
jgi:hypothetical protein